MMNAGVVVESGDKFKALIDKIKGLTEGEGNKGIQYINESIDLTLIQNNALNGTFTTTVELDFVPMVVFIETEDYDGGYISFNSNYHNLIANNYGNDRYAVINTSSNSKQLYMSVRINGNAIELDYRTSFSPLNYTLPITYYAIGVGEEDTTLRDSLASILENKGVDVTEEDDMASLISKVDTISGGLDIISATELPATGKENQICVITNNDIDEYSIIPRYENNVNGKITLISCDDTSLPLITTNGRVSYEFYFSDVIYNNEYLGSYYYSNGWKQLTQPKQYLYKYGTWVNKTIMGTISPDGDVLVNLGDGLKIVKGSNRFAYCYFSGSASLAEYNTIEIWATNNNTSQKISLSIEGRDGNGPSEGTPSNSAADGWTSSVYKSGSATLKTGFNKCLIDISNFTDTCANALICRNLDNAISGANVTIHAILIY
jgi:hypothetical protein